MSPELLEYQLSPEVRAFSTTRFGGVGVGNYSEFNITHYCGDDQAHVEENRKLLCQELSIHDRQLILPHQVHGNQVLEINDDFLKLDEVGRKAQLEGVDALVTSIPQICIGVSTADCVPLLIYDECRKVSAAIHAGWRGTVSKIVSTTIQYMVERMGCSAEKMKVVIGPSISLAAFEVGHEVYEAFQQAGFPMESISRFYPQAHGDATYQGQSGKWHLDLWAANCLLLDDCGVDLTHIQIANVCTYDSSEDFFSARRLGIHSGRIFNGIQIK